MGAHAMDTGWYSLRREAVAEQQSGPFTWGELYARAQAGVLAPDDLVWNPQLPRWTPVSEIPGLLGAGRTSGPPPLPTWAQPWGSQPLPGQAPAKTPPALPPHWQAPTPPPLPRSRPSWLLPILVPLIALIVVGAGLGVYFGAFYSKGAATSPGSTMGGVTAPSATTPGASSSTATASLALGTAEIAVPQEASLVDSTKWGQVPANQVAVVLADGKGRGDAEQVAQTLGGSVVGEVDIINLYQIQTGGKTEADLKASLDKASGLAGVELAFPNEQLSFSDEILGVRQTPLDDRAYAGDFGKGYNLIGAQKAWNYIKGAGLGLAEVKAGVIDSYIFTANAEFDGPGKLVEINPPDIQNSGPEQITTSSGLTVFNPNGTHSTMVAGLLGADPTNGGQTGVASPALGNRLTMVSIDLWGTGYGTIERERNPVDFSQYVASNGKAYSLGGIRAMAKAIESGCRVINCSWGAPKVSSDNAKIAAAYRKFFGRAAAFFPGVTFVCAAGNESGAIDPTNYYPAGAGSGLPNVITVGNVMNDTSAADSSNTAGEKGEVTLAAPGQEAVQGADLQGNAITDQTDVEGKGVHVGGGTSAAAPQVSAAAAMLVSLDPNLSAAQIKQILSDTARPGPAGMGSGILAIDEAVFEVISMVRKEKGLPELTREQLEAGGVIDAVATTTATPNVYSVRGILAAIPEKAAQVTITASNASVGGNATQSVPGPAGDAEWPTVTVTGPKATVTVTRKDSGASSVISFPASVWELTVEITRHDDTENRRVYTTKWKAEITADADGNLSGSGKGSWHAIGVTRAADQITENGTMGADVSLTYTVSGTVETTAKGRILTIVPTLGDYTVENLVFNSPSPPDELRASFRRLLPKWLSDGFAQFTLTAASDKPLTATITCGKYTGTATLTPLR